jgi:hypothetical protein
MVRAALWLDETVGEMGIFTKADLRAAIPGIEQIDRRMRDLRMYGWRIDDSKQDASLRPNQLRLVHRGVPVWDQARRRAASPATISARTRQEVFDRDGHRCVRCGAQAGEFFVDQAGVRVKLSAGHVYPNVLRGAATAENLITSCQRCNEAIRQHTSASLSGDQVWERIHDLGIREKRELLSWMTTDRRTVSSLERVFGEYRQLPAVEREQLTARLRALLLSEA